MFDHERLDVYPAARQLAALMITILEDFPKGNARLKDQLDRCTLSIPLNIAEGAGRFAPGDKAHFYRMARGSALECAACLDVGEIRGVIAAEQVRMCKQLLLRIVGMLTKLARAMQTRDERHLENGKARER